MQPPTPDASPALPPLIQLRGITKAFPGLLANDRVSLALRAGEVHALLGENGAGKSTLMQILSGVYRADAGDILLNGQVVTIRSPADALKAGIGMVYQHFMLVPNLTVTENLLLGRPGLPFRLNLAREAARVEAMSLELGLPVPPLARIQDLSVGEQQRVELIRQLQRGVKVLILDEPTAVLTPQEASELLATLRTLAGRGQAIALISHKLHEVLTLADRLTVMRRGRVVASELRPDQVTPSDLARLMVGDAQPASPGSMLETGTAGTNTAGTNTAATNTAATNTAATSTAAADTAHTGEVSRQPTQGPGEPILSLEAVQALGDRGETSLRGVSLVVRSGEMVGIAGVAGNGQRELAEVIAGLRPVRAGKVCLRGHPLSPATASRALELGVGYVPEDRHGVGTAGNLSLLENLIFRRVRRPPLSTRLGLRWPAARAYASSLLERYQVVAPSLETPARLLSGGNLQKLILARELTEQPPLLVVASPSRGLDVGATAAVHARLQEHRASGGAVLLISSDLDEVLALSDRVVVLHRGLVAGQCLRSEADRTRLGRWMAGLEAEGGAA